MNLPQKIEALRKATVFNKKTKKEAFEELKKDKSYLMKCLNEDVKENVIFRNYEDYIISCILEKKRRYEKTKTSKKTKSFFK